MEWSGVEWSGVEWSGVEWSCSISSRVAIVADEFLFIQLVTCRWNT